MANQVENVCFKLCLQIQKAIYLSEFIARVIHLDIKAMLTPFIFTKSTYVYLSVSICPSITSTENYSPPK